MSTIISSILLGINAAIAGPVAHDTPRVVEFDLRKNLKQGPDLVKIAAPNGHAEVQLANEQYYYQIELDIGTPGQRVDFTIDTGSSDLWVMSAKNPYCTDDPNNKTGINCTGSVFDSDESTTYTSLKTPFSIEYGDHTVANGTLGRDNLWFGGNTIVTNATFAVADVVNSTTCVFGIGFIGNEAGAHVYRNGSGVYPTYFNVPTLMKEQELISTNAYSLWLNDVNSDTGSILFGGIDRAKYTGPLWVMPVYNQYHKYTDRPIQTRVILNSITADNHPLADFSIAVLLDSGTSFAYLPEEIMHALGKALGFTYDKDLGYYIGSIPRAMGNVKMFHLNFGGATLDVPASNLLIAVTEADGVTPVKVDNEPQALLAVGAAEDDYMYILGDVFLRSMYAVFDIDHYQIGLANAKMNVTDSDIVAIDASIPGGIPVPQYTRTRANNASFAVHPFTPRTPAPVSLTESIGNISSITTAIPPLTSPKTPLAGSTTKH